MLVPPRSEWWQRFSDANEIRPQPPFREKEKKPDLGVRVMKAFGKVVGLALLVLGLVLAVLAFLFAQCMAAIQNHH